MIVVLYSLSLLFAGLLVLAVGHKVHVLVRGGASREPLMKLSRLRSSHATTLLLLAGALELAVCATLVVAPPVGFAALALLTITYSFDLRRLPEDTPCNCFGGALKTPNSRTAIWRNGTIATTATVGFLLYATGAVEVGSISQTTAGVALILAAGLISIDLLRFVPRASVDDPRTGVGPS